MKRARPLGILTLIIICGGVAPARAQGRDGPTDLEVTELVAVRNGVAARLCPGSENTVRVTVVWHGAVPTKMSSLRLSLVLPGGPPAGALIAEGSITARPDAPVTTLTFLHVEVSDRLRGRGARLVVRANFDGAIAEPELNNNVRELAIDRATDWGCPGGSARP